MKKHHLFFIKRLLISTLVLITVFSDLVSGQEIEADSLIMPMDTMLFISDTPPLDSIPALPDSLRRRFVVRLADPLDTLSNRLFAYNVLSRNSYLRTQVTIDTTLTRFEINNPVMRYFYAGAYIGNLGLSYYPISFSDRKRPSDYSFLDNVAIFLHDPEETTYYQTQFPFTHINFSSAGPKRFNETIFNLVHTQNVNKNWNLGLYYDTYSSVGEYNNQNASVNGFSLFSAYRGNQYSMYSNFNWNNVRMRENGGLADIYEFENSVIQDDASGHEVRSGIGKTIMLNRSFYLMHSYSPAKIYFGRNRADRDTIEASRFAFVHTLRYEWNTREHSDTATYALQGKESYFWEENSYWLPDSIHFRRITNHVEILFREQSRNRFTAGFSAGALMEIDRYNTNVIPRDIFNNFDRRIPQGSGWGGDLPEILGTERTVIYRQTNKYVNTAITGSFFNHTGRFLNWDINGRLYFTGYKIGDVNIDGNVRLHYFTAKGRNTLLLGGSIDNVNPGYFLNNFYSNLIVWENNNFALSQEIRLRGEFIAPARKLKLGVYLSQLNNYIYFNKEAKPEQTSEPLATGTAYVEKDIRLGYFGFRFRVYGQYSSNEAIIPLPALAGFQSTYFEGWLVKNVLNIQLGWNIVYNTPYYAYSYMPATGKFYLQEEQRIGNYPFFDVFLNLQIKRARIFIKTDGLNTLFSDNIGKRNYMVYRYPTNDFRMKFGVSWTFYD